MCAIWGSVGFPPPCARAAWEPKATATVRTAMAALGMGPLAFSRSASFGAALRSLGCTRPAAGSAGNAASARGLIRSQALQDPRRDPGAAGAFERERVLQDRAELSVERPS